MSEPKLHDLHEFMGQISDEMSAEYERIRKRAGEDPGTAGDQGEENWAELLREWLPRTYEIVTKGRIISHDGVTSPQIDVLVLSGAYPKKLLNKKLYLAAGVAAAFECKTTLKSLHIAKAVENCARVKALYPARTGTPYHELRSPVVCGLLAHSHSWKGPDSAPLENIEQKMRDADLAHTSHPCLQLDLLCVADLATWSSFALAYVLPGGPGTGYTGHIGTEAPHLTPIGALIANLSRKLAWENPSLRDLADYYQFVNILGGRVRATSVIGRPQSTAMRSGGTSRLAGSPGQDGLSGVSGFHDSSGTQKLSLAQA